jgi:uncharacterized protein YecT (DUF1311 family)
MRIAFAWGFIVLLSCACQSHPDLRARTDKAAAAVANADVDRAVPYASAYNLNQQADIYDAGSLEVVREMNRKGDSADAVLLENAVKAWETDTWINGDYDAFGDPGTMANEDFAPDDLLEEAKRRFYTLFELENYSPGYFTDAKDLAREDANLNKWYNAIRSVEADPSQKNYYDSFVRGQKAWLKYRDAWVAMIIHRFGGKFGADKVKIDVTYRLTKVRAYKLRTLLDTSGLQWSPH